MASSASPTDKDMLQLAENLRTKYIQEHSDDIDPRDLKRLQLELHHALKFIRHNRGNFNNAYNNMVESYKWRKSFGINDIKYEDIDENLWKSGMALNHGEDRQGNPIAILNIHMHKKDSKKALMIQKWIAFCYEMHCRIHPDKKMLMIFDMTGAGLAQMDMDLVRFVVNCFKIYFPNILAALLVYNMPWVLQAAWKIVQGWLSEGAASKVKFVTNENIQEYISPEHLLTKYGGYDQWQFNFEVEHERMLQLVDSYHDVAAEDGDDPQDDGLGDDDRLTPVAEEEDDEEMIGGAGGGGRRERGGGGRKQVRFSSGLPPTRQSRFGRQDEDDIPRSVSPDQQLLQQGASSSSDFRRRQVNRLINRQDSGKSSSSRSADRRRVSDPSALDPNSSIASLMGEEDIHRSSNGTPLTLKRSGSNTIGDLMLSPWAMLQFSGKKDEESVCTITLTNVSEKTVAYKIKTTAPLRYKVRPNLALIDGKAAAKVKVMLTSGSSSDDIIQDKFLVQTYTFDSKSSVPNTSRLSSFWKGLPQGAIKEHRMRCRRGTADKAAESLNVGGVSGGGHMTAAGAGPSGGKTSDAQVTRSSGGRSINMEREVARLVEVNNDLCKRMSRLQKLNYLTVLLLLVLIAVVYLY